GASCRRRSCPVGTADAHEPRGAERKYLPVAKRWRTRAHHAAEIEQQPKPRGARLSVEPAERADAARDCARGADRPQSGLHRALGAPLCLAQVSDDTLPHPRIEHGGRRELTLRRINFPARSKRSARTAVDGSTAN